MDLFLIVLYTAGLLIATAQDLKRREFDNWLGLFLLITGSTYILLKAISLNNPSYAFNLLFFLSIFFLLGNLFYLGRVFAGGDAKLLFALTPLFIDSNIVTTSINSFIYLLLFLISGSIYGLIYSFVLYLKNSKEINKTLRVKKILFFTFLSLVFLALSTIHTTFLLLAVISILPALLSFSMALEKAVMIKEIPGNKLREGDWLAENIIIKNKKIVATWEGLTKEDIKLLKNVKKIKIKEGLPFVPSFLFGFIIYLLGKEYFISKVLCMIH